MSWQAWLARMRLRQVFRRTPPPGITRADYVQAVREAFDSQMKFIPGLPAGAQFSDVDSDGTRGAWLVAPGIEPVRTLYYVHGGGYVWGSPETHADLALRLSREMAARVFLPDYRLAPEDPFPAALDDAVAGWRWLLRQDGVEPTATVVAGDSAGGGLTLACLHALRDAMDPLPAAACLIAPWTDLTGTAPSIDANDPHDPVLSAFGVRMTAPAYHGDLPADDPRVSPLFADLSNLPPILIQVGSQEILLDDSRRLAERVSAAGGSAALSVWPKMPHVWHMLAFAVPEGRQAIAEMADFVQQHS